MLDDLRSFLESLRAGEWPGAPLRDRRARRALVSLGRACRLDADREDAVSEVLLTIVEQVAKNGRPWLDRLLSLDDTRLRRYFHTSIRRAWIAASSFAAERHALRPHVRRALAEPSAREIPVMPLVIVEGGRFRYELVRQAVQCMRASGEAPAGVGALTAALVRRYFGLVSDDHEPCLACAGSPRPEEQLRLAVEGPLLAHEIIELLGPEDALVVALKARGETDAAIATGLGVRPQRVNERLGKAKARLGGLVAAGHTERSVMAGLAAVVDVLESERARRGDAARGVARETGSKRAAA